MLIMLEMKKWITSGFIYIFCIFKRIFENAFFKFGYESQKNCKIYEKSPLVDP
jgi:hypothetical protein